MAASTPSNEGSALERHFHIRERGSTVRTEVLGGVVTFLTMAYIVFVNPAILGAAGMPVDAVTVATALGAALFTAIMGLSTNLPFALAAGLGINAVVAFDLILGRGLPWRGRDGVHRDRGRGGDRPRPRGPARGDHAGRPAGDQASIGVGIGLFIALVGFRDAGITVNNPATGIGLGVLTTGAPMIALAGLLVMIILTARGFRGAILVGILVSAALGLIFGVLDTPDDIARLPKGS